MRQKEARGGCRLSGGSSVAGLNHRFQVFHVALAVTYLEEGADDGAHHIAQEAVGGDDKSGFDDIPLCVALLNTPVGLRDGAEEGLHIGLGAGERLKILLAEEAVGGLVHLLEVQSLAHACARPYTAWVFPRGDTILVGAGEGIETRMGILADGEDAL